jgi:carnitine O-palmitoyltransferase 2
LKSSIKEALDKYKESTSRVQIKNFELFKYGRSMAKKIQISPDSLMQSGIQIAHYKAFGKFVPTYESASTCAFKHGRTETMRPATLKTKQLSEYLAKTGDWKSNADEILRLMIDASKVHNQLVKEAAMGNGFDRHLFAMKVKPYLTLLL